MANEFFYGSLCLSNIPKRLVKKVNCKDGKDRLYLDVKVVKRKEPSQFGHTHFVSCEPRDPNDRVEGEIYICGDLKEYTGQTQQSAPTIPTAEELSNDLPF